MTENEIGTLVVEVAIAVHRELGPSPLEIAKIAFVVRSAVLVAGPELTSTFCGSLFVNLRFVHPADSVVHLPPSHRNLRRGAAAPFPNPAVADSTRDWRRLIGLGYNARMKRAPSLLLAFGLAALVRSAEPFHFTVTADPRDKADAFEHVLLSIRDQAGGPGVFHVSPGDIDMPQPLRAAIDRVFGREAVWFPGVGNHDADNAEAMTWLRKEFASGHGTRKPLRSLTTRTGPAGTASTTYAWDHGNAHFVMLNVYWDGTARKGADVAAPGTIAPPLRNWLAQDLETTTQAVTFVFAHEPAFPMNRHVGSSLDRDPDGRDAFWQVLETNRAAALIVGHTHFYSRHRPAGARVWQIDVGNAGNGAIEDDLTFLRVDVSDTNVAYAVWRDDGKSPLHTERWQEPLPAPATARALK